MERQMTSAAGKELPGRTADLPQTSKESTAPFDAGTDAPPTVSSLQLRLLELELENEALRRAKDSAESLLRKERRQAGETIAQAMAEFEGFFAVGPELACITGADGRFKRVNPAWETLLGVGAEPLIGRSMLEFVHPEDREATRRELRRQARGEACANFVIRFRCPDGSYRWLEWKSTPAKGGSLFYATARDITERTRSTEALIKEAALNKALLDTVRAVVLILDKDGAILYCNPFGLELSGYSSPELIGRTVWDFLLPPEEMAPVSKAWNDLKADKELRYFENNWRTKQGALCRLAWTSTVLPDETGRPEYVIGIAFDITERQRAEEERELYFKFFNGSSDLMCMADPNGCFKKVNPACLRTLGYPEQELLARPFLDFVHPDDRQATVDEMARQLVRGFSFNFENRYLCRDGMVRWLSWRAAYDREAGVTYATARDITDLREMHGELTAARDAADAANLAKSRFLSNMSHEIRTPMNGIIGMAQLLGLTGLDADQRGYLEAIRTSADSLLTLINELLDLSKIEAGKIELERTGFSLRGGIREVIKAQQPLAEGKGLALRAEIADEIPDNLIGDRLRLQQILLNLLGNGVKFTEKGGVTASVQVRERRENQALFRFTVTDTGIGISPEARERIFTPFTQADASISRNYGGTGLGLSICMRLATLMGGRIWVQSREGVGSSFHVELPFQLDQAQALPRSGGCERAQHLPRVWDGPPLHLLLVEDHEINRRFALEILRRRGYLMAAAPDGKEAIERWKQGGVDLILMDVQMPVMDGLETTRIIRQCERETGEHVPIIALTAHALQEDRAQFLDLGFDGYVSKPIDIDLLIGEIKRCLPEGFPRTAPSPSPLTAVLEPCQPDEYP